MTDSYPCLRVMKLADLTPAEWNPRTITPAAMKRLTKSLHEFGNLQPVVFNVRTKTLISGHQRVKCLQALEKTETEVWCVDLDAQKEQAANLRLNQYDGDWNRDWLKNIMEGLDTGDFDMDLTGFPEKEREELMTAAPPEQENSSAPRTVTCPECGREFTPGKESE